MPVFNDWSTIIIEEDEKVNQPEQFKVQLKDHQMALIYQASLIESGNYHINDNTINTNVGILCDKPRSGKSYVALGLLLNDIFRTTDMVYNGY